MTETVDLAGARTALDRARLDDFAAFLRIEIATGDLTPNFPVLTHLTRDLAESERVWASILFMAYYNVASGWCAYGTGADPVGPVSEWASRLHAGTDRRAHRVPARLQRHLASWSSWSDAYGGIVQFLRRGLGDDPAVNWREATLNVERVWGNGRWAGYTTGEIMTHVHGWPLAAYDVGNEFSTGPRRGLALLLPAVEGNSAAAVRVLDEQAAWVRSALSDEYDLDVTFDQVETGLCDFQAMAAGRYYPGKDIENISAFIVKCEDADAPPERIADLRAAMVASFDPAYLVHVGAEKDRNGLYASTGRISTR